MSLSTTSKHLLQQDKAELLAPFEDATDGDDVHHEPDVDAVLHLRQFSQHPTLDFGTLIVGSRKTLYLKATNPTLLSQHLVAEKVPVQDGFLLSEDPNLPGAASLNWSSSVVPHGSVILPVTWQPSAAAAVSKLLVFKLDGKHRLQVKLLGKATVQYTTTKRSADQAMRSSGRLTSSDASSSSRTAVCRSLTSVPNLNSAATDSQGKQPSIGVRSSINGIARSSGANGTAADSAKFKVPLKRTTAAASQLRLKPPSGAGAAGTRSSTGAAARPEAAAQTAGGMPMLPAGGVGRVEARSRPSSNSGVLPGGMLSPTSPAAGRQLTAELNCLQAESSLKSAGWIGATGRQSIAKGSINRSGRPASASMGSAAKVPNSSKKTFRFFHTEMWMNKQDRAFSAWLNHLLLPYTPEYLRAASEGDTSSALSDLRLAARVKGAMISCYRHDPEVRDIMMKVEKCIDDGKLRLKPEVVMFGDLVQRRQALDVLMSYNPFWLHLAVEVVTQKAFRVQAAPAEPATPGTPGNMKQPVFVEAMRSFLVRELLSDPDLAAEIEIGKGAAHFNLLQYQEELGALVLKRFLLLVMLMDRAATHLSGPYRTPLLFKLTGTIKSSKQVVMDFLHGRLFGEGNVGRHLELLGYKLLYSQSPLMEYPFAITNLAVDLRDGLRLIKVAEVLTGDNSLLSQARFPADRKPMQLYNSNLALSALSAAGVNLAALPTTKGIVRFKPDDIVDGDRERTLALLWAVARTLQLGAVLKVGTLKAEVQRVLARVRQMGSRPLLPGASFKGRGGHQVPLGVYMNDELLAMLMDWVQAVCKGYAVDVQNFTTCFGDGVVLCLLVHYYLPNAIALEQIHITKQRRDAASAGQWSLGDLHDSSEDGQSCMDGTIAAGSFAADSSMFPAPPPSVTGSTATSGAAEAKEWISKAAPGGWYAEFDLADFNAAETDPAGEDSKGIAANFKAVHRAAKALGGVPEMLSSKDFAEHGPDERATILYVAFLCSRLLECSKDDRAAHIIQRAWRQSKAKATGMARANLNKWVAAAIIIQSHARGWLSRRHTQQLSSSRAAAALVLQTSWRGRQARMQLLQLVQHCIVIQRQWRAWLARRNAKRQEAAAVIQRCWRMYKVAKNEAWLHDYLDKCLQACQALKDARQQKQQAVVKLQATWRMVQIRKQFVTIRTAAVTLQSAWRGRQERIRCQQQHSAAVTLQAAWRARQPRMHYSRLKAAAISLQAVYQGWKVRQAVKQSNDFAIFLQSCCRCRRDRALFLLKRGAAVSLQAAIRGWQERERLQQLQTAAVSVQALCRGMLTRRWFQQQSEAAIFIQSCWRGSKARAAYQQQRAAAISLQACWRCCVAKTIHQQQRAAAVALQSCWRGMLVRRDLKRQAAAVTVLAAAWRRCSAAGRYAEQVQALVQLQAVVRMHQAQQQFKSLRAASVLLQSTWRGRAVRKQVQQQHQAALLIQSCWRSHVQQLARADTIAAAVVIQAAVRRFQACSCYQKLHAAAVALQTSWRALQARQLLQQHKAAATIQAQWRRYTAVRQLRNSVNAAVTVQAFWRMLRQKQSHQTTVAAAVAMQAAVRGQQVRCQYSQQQAASLVLQSSWRALQGRQQLQEHKAARSIQTQWRRHKAQTALKQTVEAVVTIQSCWRAHVQRQLYSDVTAAAISLQAAVRGCLVRGVYQQQQAAAVLLQSSWRAHQARQKLQHHKAAAVIQAHWRRHAAMAQLQQAVESAVAIQSFWRMHAQQRLYSQAVSAAVTLQAAVRCHQVSSSYRCLQAAAVTLQSSWRGHVSRLKLQQLRCAAVVIQSQWRRHIAVSEYRQVQKAAIAITTAYRRHAAVRGYQQLLAAAVSIQSAARAKAARVSLQQQRVAALALQQSWRAYTARKALQQHKAAVVIQAHVRSWLVRSEIARKQAAAVKIRAAWLCYHRRQQYLTSRAAAVTIQAAVRCLLQRQQYAAYQAAAATLQASWHGLLCRRRYAEQQTAATTVQAAYRCYKQQQQYRRWRVAAIYIQAAVRMHYARQQLQLARSAAIKLQTAWRGYVVRSVTAQQQSAATRIQAAWRGYLVRKQVAQQKSAATLIQAAWRGCTQHRRYCATLRQLSLLQATWRAHQAAGRYQQLRSAAVILQAAVKGCQARKALQLEHLTAAAVVMQSAWRGRRVRQMYARQAAAALVIQRYARGMHARHRAKERKDYLRSAKELQKMLLMLHTRSRAATTIQAAWKGWKQRRLFQPVWQQHVQQKAATVLQLAWRCRQARAVVCKLQDELPHLMAQRNWRRAVAVVHKALHKKRLEAMQLELAAVTVQSVVRGWQVRHVVAKQLAGIRRFQALWRGYQVRKRCGRAGRDARRRVAAATAAVVPPQRRIGVRTREALNVLLASKQCSQVITAVAAIEFSTRYSKACCQLMVENGGVTALLEFMRSCNRSKPHVEMLNHALACLANICRHVDLLPGVLHALDCIIILSERLQVFRDTEDIFMATMAILAALVRSDQGALHVATSAPAAVRLWEGILQLLRRKMEMERRYIERLEGKKGSDVTAKQSTSKMVSAAAQCDALERVWKRVETVAVQHGVNVLHMPPRSALPAAMAGPGAALEQSDELVPRSAAAVVQPNLWQPKNTIVRGALRESVATRTNMLAAVAAGVPVGPTAAKSEATAANGSDAGAVRVLGSDVPPQLMQHHAALDQGYRGDQSYKHGRGH